MSSEEIVLLAVFADIHANRQAFSACLDFARARDAAAAAGSAAARRLSFVKADVEDYRDGGGRRFHLAFIALGSLMLLPDRAAQRHAIETLAAQPAATP